MRAEPATDVALTEGLMQIGPGIYILQGKRYLDVPEFLEAEGIELTPANIDKARRAASQTGMLVLEHGGRVR